MAFNISPNRSPSPSPFVETKPIAQPDTSDFKLVPTSASTDMDTSEPRETLLSKRVIERLKREGGDMDTQLNLSTPTCRKRTKHPDSDDEGASDHENVLLPQVRKFFKYSEEKAQLSASSLLDSKEFSQACMKAFDESVNLLGQFAGDDVQRVDDFIDGGCFPEKLHPAIISTFRIEMSASDIEREFMRSQGGELQLQAFPFNSFGGLTTVYCCPVYNQDELIEVDILDKKMLEALCDGDRETAIQARSALDAYKARPKAQKMTTHEFISKQREAFAQHQNPEVLSKLLGTDASYFSDAQERGDEKVLFSLASFYNKLELKLKTLPSDIAPFKAISPDVKESMGMTSFLIQLHLGGKCIVLSDENPDNLIKPITLLRDITKNLYNRDYPAAAQAMAQLQQYNAVFDTSGLQDAIADIDASLVASPDKPVITDSTDSESPADKNVVTIADYSDYSDYSDNDD